MAGHHIVVTPFIQSHSWAVDNSHLETLFPVLMPFNFIVIIPVSLPSMMTRHDILIIPKSTTVALALVSAGNLFNIAEGGDDIVVGGREGGVAHTPNNCK